MDLQTKTGSAVLPVAVSFSIKNVETGNSISKVRAWQSPPIGWVEGVLARKLLPFTGLLKDGDYP
ncbi:hypothetical protein F6455_15450 [Proteobacteria bacterium 005FR1]|nr:hypothetical protein [Proteobacteria bacterium 005FR1]